MRDLTASELGAVAGLDAYKTPYDIWAWKSGLAEPPAETPVMRRGRLLEPGAIAALCEERPDLTVIYPRNVYLRDPDIRLGGTPDAVALAPERRLVVETKVISRQSHDAWAGTEPPVSWQIQTLANAMLMDADGGLLAVLVLGYADVDLVIRDIPRHAEAEARIRASTRGFWAAFDAGHAPDPDYQRDAATIRKLFPPDPARVEPVALAPGLAAALDQREELKMRMKADEETCAAIEAMVVHKLAGATHGTLPGWRVTHRMQSRAAYEVAAKDYPVLRISREKDRP
jgi:predicted phage-related endonuclease